MSLPWEVELEVNREDTKQKDDYWHYEIGNRSGQRSARGWNTAVFRSTKLKNTLINDIKKGSVNDEKNLIRVLSEKINIKKSDDADNDDIMNLMSKCLKIYLFISLPRIENSNAFNTKQDHATVNFMLLKILGQASALKRKGDLAIRELLNIIIEILALVTVNALSNILHKHEVQLMCYRLDIVKAVCFTKGINGWCSHTYLRSLLSTSQKGMFLRRLLPYFGLFSFFNNDVRDFMKIYVESWDRVSSKISSCAPKILKNNNNNNLEKLLSFLRTLKLFYQGVRNPIETFPEEIVEHFYGEQFSFKRLINSLSIAQRTSERMTQNISTILSLLSKLVEMEKQQHKEIVPDESMNSLSHETMIEWELPPDLRNLVDLRSPSSIRGIPWPFDPLNTMILALEEGQITVMASSQAPVVLNFLVLRGSIIESRGLLIKEETTWDQDIIYQGAEKYLKYLSALQGYDFHHTGYGVIPFGDKIGFVEIIPHAWSLNELISAATGLLRLKHTSDSHFEGKTNSSKSLTRPTSCCNPPKLEERELLFATTNGSSSAITYLLGVGDRHGGNVLVDESARVFHIDFGFMWGSNPKNGLGQTPIRLSTEMVDAMGGEASKGFAVFLATLSVSLQLLGPGGLGNLLLISLIVTSIGLSSLKKDEIIDNDKTNNNRINDSTTIKGLDALCTLLFKERHNSPSVTSTTEAGHAVPEYEANKSNKPSANNYVTFKYSDSVMGAIDSSRVKVPIWKLAGTKHNYRKMQLNAKLPPTALRGIYQALQLLRARHIGIVKNNNTLIDVMGPLSDRAVWSHILWSLIPMDDEYHENKDLYLPMMISMIISKAVIPSMGDLWANVVDRMQLITSSFK